MARVPGVVCRARLDGLLQPKKKNFLVSFAGEARWIAAAKKKTSCLD